jgi:hypothetical protein
VWLSQILQVSVPFFSEGPRGQEGRLWLFADLLYRFGRSFCTAQRSRPVNAQAAAVALRFSPSARRRSTRVDTGGPSFPACHHFDCQLGQSKQAFGLSLIKFFNSKISRLFRACKTTGRLRTVPIGVTLIHAAPSLHQKVAANPGRFAS